MAHWVDPAKVPSLEDLIQRLRLFYKDESIAGVKLVSGPLAGCGVADVEVLRDLDAVRIVRTEDPYEDHEQVVVETPSEEASEDAAEADEWLTFNVGGENFSTYKSTIVNATPDSALATMFNNNVEKTPAFR